MADSDKTKRIKEIIARNADSILKEEELEERLGSGKKLRIKYGVDVTAPFLHIGHAVNLWTMRVFQELGHKVVFLIGDFTTKIGDPTDRSEARKIISNQDIERGAKAFIRQVSKILITDKNVFEIQRNSTWYKKMKLSDFIKLLGGFTHSRLIERDMFQKRIGAGREVYMHEMIYPILQGYDSVMVKSDMTIIGSDQLFNEIIGRDLQERAGQKPQIIITTKITPGIHGGPKQSKSLGNYIAIDDSPKEKFGKIMSIPDELIVQYLEIYTSMPLDEIEKEKQYAADRGMTQMDLKKRLAYELVKIYHGKKQAENEKTYFEETFQKRKNPDEAFEVCLHALLDLSELPESKISKSELRRLAKQGAVEFNGKKIEDASFVFKEAGVLKIGKKKFFKVVPR